VEGNGVEFGADKAAAMSVGLFGGESAEYRHSFRDDFWRNGRFGVEGPGSSAGTRREGEQMQVAEWETANELDCLVEFIFGFAREACHDVGAKGEVWSGGAEERGDFFGIVPWAVAAMHAAKHGIRAGLQWKMGMASQARSAVFGHESDEVGIPIHWLDGTQSETRDVGLAEDLAHQRGKREAGLAELVEIAAPAAKIDSGEHQFVATSRDKASDMAENRGAGKASRGAAGLGDYAEGAAIAATFLNFEVGASLSAGDNWGFFEEGMGEGVVGQDQRLI
jgi:hypothetical protein